MREKVMGILEMATGNRAQYAIMAIGGVRRNISKEQVPAITVSYVNSKEGCATRA